jgi:endonuclease/exonuclease/phosphatase (EEP) superfamily protein YafD
MLVYSRLPLEDKATEFLVDEDAPSMHVTVVLRSGDRIRLHSMHPAPPHPEWSLSSSPRDAEMVLLARTTRHEQLPMIVIGDMNEVPWSATQRLFRKVSVLLDPRVGRGLYSTFPAKPPFPRWPLDQVFHSDAFALVRLERLGPIGSDHLPLLVELALEPTAADGQDGLDADGDAEAWAHRKLQSEGSDGNSRQAGR